MIVNLTQKERGLLQDQKSHEEMCIKKYTNYSGLASDPELRSLFQNHANTERSHLDSINQLLNGQLPNTASQNSGQSQTSNQSSNASSKSGQNMNDSLANMSQTQMSDKDFCSDLLSTEKYVSGHMILQF